MKKRKPSGAAGDRAHLIDTSTLIWATAAPERLSKRAYAALERGENVVSVASYWEIALKTQKGQLAITDVASWWRRATDLFYAQVLPIRSTHIGAIASLPPLHKDPFDRILIAQAVAEGLPFVTSDELISAYPVRTIW
jgi:PIN domain nuclease of toxin-antitoxin system